MTKFKDHFKQAQEYLKKNPNKLAIFPDATKVLEKHGYKFNFYGDTDVDYWGRDLHHRVSIRKGGRWKYWDRRWNDLRVVDTDFGLDKLDQHLSKIHSHD